MAHAQIPVDVLNPGQVFACLGLLEAATVLIGPTHGGFYGDGGEVVFHLDGPGSTNPVAAVLGFLAEAEVRSFSPETPSDASSALATEKWSVPTQWRRTDEPFPIAKPESPASLPALLHAGGKRLVIDHWGDASKRDNVKFWAGAGGYPGVALLRDALDLARPQLALATADPFAISAAQPSSFRFDWRRDYTAIGIGYSLNNHAKITPLGYPLIEVLAAIGLTHARPLRPTRRDKLLYRYAIPIGVTLPLCLLRAALGCAALPFPKRTFRITLDWPGKEGQARCITNVTEESCR